MGQNEGKKCKNVRESSTRSKRQELTANVGYPLLEIVPVTDTSEILSRTGLKSVRNAYTGFEQVGLAVYMNGNELCLCLASCVCVLRSAFCVMLGTNTMLGAMDNMEFINVLSLNTIFVILQVR